MHAFLLRFLMHFFNPRGMESKKQGLLRTGIIYHKIYQASFLKKKFNA